MHDSMTVYVVPSPASKAHWCVFKGRNHYFCFCIILYVPGVFKSNQNAVFQTPLYKPFPMQPDVVLTWAFASSWAAGCICLNIAGLNYTVKQSRQEKVVVSKWSHTDPAMRHTGLLLHFKTDPPWNNHHNILFLQFTSTRLADAAPGLHSFCSWLNSCCSVSLSVSHKLESLKTLNHVCRNSNWSSSSLVSLHVYTLSKRRVCWVRRADRKWSQSFVVYGQKWNSTG